MMFVNLKDNFANQESLLHSYHTIAAVYFKDHAPDRRLA